MLLLVVLFAETEADEEDNDVLADPDATAAADLDDNVKETFEGITTIDDEKEIDNCESC